MPEHRMVSIALLALFVAVVAIDYWRKAKLLKSTKTPPPASPPPAQPPGA